MLSIFCYVFMLFSLPFRYNVLYHTFPQQIAAAEAYSLLFFLKKCTCLYSSYLTSVL